MNSTKSKVTTIPIALTSDNKYTPFLYTTMVSVLQSANENTFYDFYLLLDPNFSDKSKEQINTLKVEYNCNINFINMNNCFSNLDVPASWYRLLVAKFLPETIDKCIFLDDDIYVRTDLNDLYNIDLTDNYIAGVLATSYYVYADKHHCNILNIPSTKQYINTGVIVYNLKLLRKDNITQKFIELSDNNWPSYDQDVMNVICYGKIKILPPKYNVMIKHLFINDIRLYDLYTKEEIEEAKNNPYLIHFIDEQKPWQGFRKYGNYWWKTAIKTPYKFYFMFLFIKNLLNPTAKIKNLLKKCVLIKLKTNIKNKILFSVKTEITNKLERELISAKKLLAEQQKLLNKQQEEIEKLKQNLKS